jgi:CheY-like chemotaxis protein
VEIQKFINSVEALSAFCALDEDEMGRISIVFLDIQMPVMDGFTLLAEMGSEIKKRPVQPIISFIACTAEASESLQKQAFGLGFAYCITKPVLPENLEKIMLAHQIERK